MSLLRQKGGKVLNFWLYSSNSLSCDFTSLLSLSLVYVNIDKEQVSESLDKPHDSSHVRKG